MPVNTDLIRRTIAAIESDPDAWDQDSYWTVGDGVTVDDHPLSCGTTLCFAGWALRLHQGDEAFAAEAFERGGSRWHAAHALLYDIDFRAARLLGLNENDAHGIFYCFTNSVAVLKDRITEVTGVTFGGESDG